jgi:hypothetical protein
MLRAISASRKDFHTMFFVVLKFSRTVWDHLGKRDSRICVSAMAEGTRHDRIKRIIAQCKETWKTSLSWIEDTFVLSLLTL